jgi:hypothetical protein
MAICLVAGSLCSIGSMGAAAAVEREWTKTLCGSNDTALSKLNAGGLHTGHIGNVVRVCGQGYIWAQEAKQGGPHIWAPPPAPLSAWRGNKRTPWGALIANNGSSFRAMVAWGQCLVINWWCKHIVCKLVELTGMLSSQRAWDQCMVPFLHRIVAQVIPQFAQNPVGLRLNCQGQESSRMSNSSLQRDSSETGLQVRRPTGMLVRGGSENQRPMSV